jgi:hypothetical protein
MQLERIQTKIYEIRDQKVMLDFDLAELYEVENRVLKQAVKRNPDRFPDDFMFQLTKIEWQELITICDKLPEGVKFSPATPFAFTEQGVAMLSSVLKSKQALQVNIAIMRAFVFMRQYALSHRDLTEKLQELEGKYDKQFKDVYEAINFLIQKDNQEAEQKQRKRIGYKSDETN